MTKTTVISVVLAVVPVAEVAPIRMIAAPPANQQSVVPPSQTVATTRFDVVSVKPCNGSGGGRAGGSSGQGGMVSSGRLVIDCQSLYSMIMTAYRTYAEGRLNPPWTWPTPPSDESLRPDWIMRDRFTIEATTDAHPSPEVMRGPMLQAVLEDRFKVKVHVNSREVPVDELIVAKGGSKLTPFKPGSCVPREAWNDDRPPLQPGQRLCGGRPEVTVDSSGQRFVSNLNEGVSLDDYARSITLHGIPVVNKTGLSGLFTFRMEYIWTGDGFADGLKKVGLDTRPGTAMREFLILEHFERPTPNAAIASGTRR